MQQLTRINLALRCDTKSAKLLPSFLIPAIVGLLLMVPVAVTSGSSLAHVFLIHEAFTPYFRYMHPEKTARLNPGLLIIGGSDTIATDYLPYFNELLAAQISVFSFDVDDYQAEYRRAGAARYPFVESALKVVLEKMGILRYARKGKLAVLAIGPEAHLACRVVLGNPTVGALILIDPVLSAKDWLVFTKLRNSQSNTAQSPEVFTQFGFTSHAEFDLYFKTNGPLAVIANIHVPLLILETRHFSESPEHATAVSELLAIHNKHNKENKVLSQRHIISGKPSPAAALVMKRKTKSAIKQFLELTILTK